MISSLAVKGDAQVSEGTSSLQRSISSAISPLLSPYILITLEQAACEVYLLSI